MKHVGTLGFDEQKTIGISSEVYSNVGIEASMGFNHQKT
jgi:hypothetical protein